MKICVIILCCTNLIQSTPFFIPHISFGLVKESKVGNDGTLLRLPDDKDIKLGEEVLTRLCFVCMS